MNKMVIIMNIINGIVNICLYIGVAIICTPIILLGLWSED
jgi:hypothetical protein